MLGGWTHRSWGRSPHPGYTCFWVMGQQEGHCQMCILDFFLIFLSWTLKLPDCKNFLYFILY